MATGTVKWFNPAKGYGFIQPRTAAETYSCISPRSSAPA
jgi:cold shock CspA family protein